MTVTTDFARREFLQLAKEFKPDKPPRGGYNFAGWYVSEKLDGGRCFWDGGITRGMKTEDVPWSGIIDPKTGGFKKKIKPFATGLWSRYGNPICAPDWFVNGLPCMPLDGELFIGRGQFQSTMSVIRKDNPIDSEWREIRFAVYSSPPFESVFGNGEIKNSNFHRVIDWSIINKWLPNRVANMPGGEDFMRASKGDTFDAELRLLDEALSTPTDFAYLHPQIRLPDTHAEAVFEVEKRLDLTLNVGGEGLIIRSPEALWHPKRMTHILKVKPALDAEAMITGFTSGRVGKQGLLQGKIGALITCFDGKRLEIAGLTHKEREFMSQTQTDFAYEHPGVDMPADFKGRHFSVGDTITFKYRELSDDGIPKDARYFRPAAE